MKTVKAIKTVFLTVLLSCSVASVFWFPNWGLFASKHPGLIAVLVGVAGEVYFDWTEEVGKHARWKKFFMALLVIGLTYELYEASESDKEAASAIRTAAEANDRAKEAEKSASQANERAARFDMDRELIAKEAEEIRSTNLSLQIELNKLQGRAIDVEQEKTLISGIKELIPTMPKFEIVIWAQDAESRAYGNDILSVFKKCGVEGHFFVNGAFRQDIVLNPGLEIAIFKTNMAELSPVPFAADKLFKSARIESHVAFEGTYAGQFFGTNNINIFLGAKPKSY